MEINNGEAVSGAGIAMDSERSEDEREEIRAATEDILYWLETIFTNASSFNGIALAGTLLKTVKDNLKDKSVWMGEIIRCAI